VFVLLTMPALKAIFYSIGVTQSASPLAARCAGDAKKIP
jgi:hypothetical protein